MSCVDVSLSNATQGDTVLMVTSCPPGTEDDTACVTKDYDNANTITEVPVSSSKETVVFKNIGCAACHGQKNNLTKWNFKMECDRIVDINHMSSYKEIFQAGLDNMCNMSYQSSLLFDHFRCSPEHSSPALKQCNMTGQWEEYDSHIDWACRNFQKPYRGFENIFCFACNPGKRSGDDRLIAGCNKTGMWNPYDLELEKACLYYPTLQIAYPYKNRYCYLCNRRNNMSDIFMDAKTSIELEKWETLDNSYELILGIQSFRHQYIYQADIHSVMLNSTATLSDDHYSTYKNVSKLLFLYFLHYGNNGHCPEEGDDTNEAHQQCTCSLSCVTSSRCCAEFALSGPVVNANEFKNSLSVSKCYRNYELSNSTLQEKCETTQLSKGIFQIPVRSRNSDILYRNVYCLLCNEGQEKTNSPQTKPKYDPLDLHIRCNVTFLTERYIFLENLLKEFDQMEGQGQYCTFSTVYDRYDDKKPVPSTIDKCNVTGEWDIYDSDIEWACLNYNHDITSDHYSEIYKNIFCEMCNKALDTDLEYTSCETNSTIADDCERFPQVTSMKPYKNIFCMICNYISPSTKLATAGVVVDVSDIRPGGCHDRRTDGDGDGGISLITATVRDLFSISMAPEFLGEVDHVIDTYGNHCLENEIYDMEKVGNYFLTKGIYFVP
ncbi:uncharacterized protein LOC117336531 [Pecten maximus]|uniref:uncharacterized protein LOC117336531 n=1 Tax=Pecten maximus TaxID=6579 RepID=UPI0014583104|nr:uncharacterized protein LOC117336531 [Pecten maximus]